MTPVDHIAILLFKELEGQLSGAESAELQEWKRQSPEHAELSASLQDEDELTNTLQLYHPDNKAEVCSSILRKIELHIDFKVVPFYKRSFFRIAVAACIGALIFVGGYFLFFNDKKVNDLPPIVKSNDIQPPKENKAMIKLPDGSQILLDTLTTISQGNITVTKTADGRIVYTGFGEEGKFNTLTNPRGSKVIDIQLADGSHVWLNAGSSVTYPVAFIGNERKVSITGEAYFEVAHNATMPFKVSKGAMTVEVLGTHFNVNAYDDDENIKVTLLEGSVKVNVDQSSLTIKPNQQAIVARDNVTLNPNVDVEAVMAWKNGRFQFGGAGIEEVMRQIARWYDVEVVYEVKPQEVHFRGGISRDVEASKVFKMLETTEAVHFRIEGKKIFVIR